MNPGVERMLLIGLSLLLSLSCSLANAQTLPPPSRTVYKCEVEGKPIYSDSPCLGAQRIDVEPTRGVDRASGQRRTGPDVSREQRRELLAEAVQPLTGMDASQFDVAVRRNKLTSAAQAECRRLDRDLPRAEAQERQAAGEARKDLQAHLLSLRQRYRTLRC